MVNLQGGESRSMATSRQALKRISSNIDESIVGIRSGPRPELSPVASAKEIGRTPLRNFGRVEVRQIVPDPEQPRKSFDPAEIERLAESMKEGQIQPIGVRWNPTLTKWMIVHGERRWRAAIKAGLDKIECRFEESDRDSASRLKRQLVENIQRRDLAPLDEANAYNQLMQLNGWTGKQLATELNITTSRVSRALALLDLPDEVQKKVSAGQLSRTSAYEISKVKNPLVQAEIAKRPLTQASAKAATRKLRGKSSKKRSARTPLRFPCENGWTIVATPPKSGGPPNYHQLAEALEQTAADVEARLRSGIRIG